MRDMPDDILIAIATELRRESGAAANLFRFINVSRRWYTLGIPLLYGNISLATRSLEPFARSFVSSKYGCFVRSLSLRIGATRSLVDYNPYLPSNDSDPWNLDSESNQQSLGPDPNQQDASMLYESFCGIEDSWSYSDGNWHIDEKNRVQIARFLPIFLLYIPILQNLNKLASFSLIIEANASWCLLPRATIAGLIDALPESCTNLELDTNANDSGAEGLHHVCQHIRSILPRMRNVRLRLGAMCSALFETGVTSASSIGLRRSLINSQASGPVLLPKLQSLVVNCGITAFGELLPQCGYEGLRKWEIGAEAWCAITSSLTELVRQQAKPLKGAKILVLSPTWGIAADLSLETQLRTDMVNKTTWALPCIPESSQLSGSGCFLIRSPDGSEQVVRNMESMDDIAEGHVWRDVVGGARLPADVLEAEKRNLPSFATGCVENPLPNLMDQWLTVHPGVERSRTFRNEQRTGMKLVLAEKRTGHHFLALRPIKEKTPEGWVRTDFDLGLEPA